jgi:hypothetical protein
MTLTGPEFGALDQEVPEPLLYFLISNVLKELFYSFDRFSVERFFSLFVRPGFDSMDFSYPESDVFNQRLSQETMNLMEKGGF